MLTSAIFTSALLSALVASAPIQVPGLNNIQVPDVDSVANPAAPGSPALPNLPALDNIPGLADLPTLPELPTNDLPTKNLGLPTEGLGLPTDNLGLPTKRTLGEVDLKGLDGTVNAPVTANAPVAANALGAGLKERTDLPIVNDLTPEVNTVKGVTGPLDDGLLKGALTQREVVADANNVIGEADKAVDGVVNPAVGKVISIRATPNVYADVAGVDAKASADTGKIALGRRQGSLLDELDLSSLVGPAEGVVSETTTHVDPLIENSV